MGSVTWPLMTDFVRGRPGVQARLQTRSHCMPEDESRPTSHDSEQLILVSIDSVPSRDT